MAFADQYQDTSNTSWIDPDVWNAVVDNAIIFEVTSVTYDGQNQYEGRSAPRYIMAALFPDPTTGEQVEKSKGFMLSPKGSSRDRVLGALAEYLPEHPGETVPMRADKVGRFVTLVAVPTA